MPRQAKIDAHRALHHIIVRGIERCKIFKHDADRERATCTLRPLGLGVNPTKERKNESHSF